MFTIETTEFKKILNLCQNIAHKYRYNINGIEKFFENVKIYENRPILDHIFQYI